MLFAKVTQSFAGLPQDCLQLYSYAVLYVATA